MRYADGAEFKKLNGYEIGDIWYPRVTKILDIKAKPALEGFFREMGSYEAADVVKNKSAEHGSLVHEMVQKIAVGETPTVPEEVRPAVEAFTIFARERGIIFHPDFIECRIWSGQKRYAGTIDALAEVDGKFGVLDIKTSTGFYSDYNLQTAAYMQALQEYDIKLALALPREIQTRWILRIDQQKTCTRCASKLREKGGRNKIRNGKSNGTERCLEADHKWSPAAGEVEIREFPYWFNDVKAFNAAKTLWEWENSYWLRQIGYLG